MNYIRYLILMIHLQNSLQQWAITHYEGYQHSFTQNSKDNGILMDCKAYNFPIFAQQNQLVKGITLQNTRSFNTTKILIEYIVPTDSNQIFSIQNKAINPLDMQQYYYGKSLLNQCFNTSDYQMRTLEYEILGKNYTEISINITLQNSESKYIAIKQITVFQVQCSQHCTSCNLDEGKTKCLKCEKGFEPSYDQCFCRQFIFENRCQQSCPEGYLPTSYNVCIKSRILDTKIVLDQKFKGKTLKLNDKSYEQVILTESTDFFVKFNLQLRNFQLLQQFNIIVNEQYLGSLAQYNELMLVGIVKNEEKQCQQAQDCLEVMLQSPIIQVNASELKIEFNFKNSKNSRRNNQLINENDSSIDIIYFEVFQLEIDQPKCGLENCLTCDQQGGLFCLRCSDGYYLNQGECVKTCPKTTFVNNNGVCVDYISQLKNSVYAIKDLSIRSYDFLGDISFKNSESSLYYRYNQSILLFGGYWSNQEFTKIFVLQPHYALTYSFTLTFIDFDRQSKVTGFYYQIDGGDKILISPEDETQIDGDSSLPDSIVNYSKYFKHSNDDLMLTVGCDAQGYCFLSNYYFIVHKCVPYCRQCTGPNKQDCQEYYQNIQEFNAKTLQCRKGYFEDENNLCQQCEVNGCQECSSRNKCLVCRKQCELKLQGQFCECQ